MNSFHYLESNFVLILVYEEIEHFWDDQILIKCNTKLCICNRTTPTQHQRERALSLHIYLYECMVFFFHLFFNVIWQNILMTIEVLLIHGFVF